MAPTVTTLAYFDGIDGAYPVAGLIADSAGDLFGTAARGGAYGQGTVYEIVKTDAGYLSTPVAIATFGPTDGAYPSTGLIADSAGNLYGTTSTTVFEIAKSATGYDSSPLTIASFPGSGASYPYATLAIDSAGNLLGTTLYGGTSNYGTVFEIVRTPAGYASTVQVLASFDGTHGRYPGSGLVADDAGNLYGTTENGGANDDGTVFELAMTDTGYASTPAVIASIGRPDGREPSGSLAVDSAGNLFGTTLLGGTDGYGAVFEIVRTADGYSAGPQVIASFKYDQGAYPYAGLIIDGVGNLFGTTQWGGAYAKGTAFEIIKTAAGYDSTPQVIATFYGDNGAYPRAGLIADSAGDLFGTTQYGGPNDNGTVFRISDSGFGVVACYCRGTAIATEHGETPVEALAIGDRVVTGSRALRPIKWIGTRTYAGRFANANPDLLPVCFKAGSLDEDTPRRDLWVSPMHAMALDGVLIPAQHLVNGTSIVRAGTVETVEYFHIELDGHDVILAEGALSETFLDDDSRGVFQNAHTFPALYPLAAPAPPRSCAPRVEGGFALEAIRRRLAARAGFSRAARPSPALRGTLDRVDARRIEGWAQDADHPDVAVCLDVFLDGVLARRVLADAFRPDLKAAGIGAGDHCFRLEWDGPLPSATDHVIDVRRSADGARLWCSPQTVAAAPFGTNSAAA